MAARGRIRIIGGRWRRRLLPVPQAAGLRPTPDRVRETLFNWLADDLPGARCLDLFAGTGALGFEAASRGASRVVMVERDARIVEHLREQARTLQAECVTIECADALAWMAHCAERFELAFLDPPFGALDPGMLLQRLHTAGILSPQARVYLECPDAGEAVAFPEGWSCLRTRRAGRVRYHLAATPRGPDP
jgi:16S rRNA (guanine966-N2)-methyltransferase